jgi:uncharacterized membrane protein
MKKPVRMSLFSRLRAYFLTGVLVTAPIGITIYLTIAVLKFIDTKVSAIFPETYQHVVSVPGAGLMLAIGFFTLFGWFARNFFGRLVIEASEYIVDRVPVIGKIYGGIKQVVETVMGSKPHAFREVVIFEYPKPGFWTLGFVAGPTADEIKGMTDDESVNVFLPTTPSPTNGILLFIPKGKLLILKMSVEDAFKMILSSGIIIPGETAKEAEAKIMQAKE